MPKYKVHDAGVRKARDLIRAHKYDLDTKWSEAAPVTGDENKEIDRQGLDEYGEWHLAVDLEASEETKGRYRFPFGDFEKLNRAALIAAKQRASQNHHADVSEAADGLLAALDKEAGRES